MGISRKQLQPWLKKAGKDEKRGIEYLKQMTTELLDGRKHLLPYAYLQTAVKWLGYRSGRLYASIIN